MICPKCGIVYDGNFCPNGCNSPTANSPQKKKGSAGITALTIIFLILFFPVGIILMWACAKNWHVAVKIVITVFFALVVIFGFANMDTDNNESADVPSQAQSVDDDTAKTDKNPEKAESDNNTQAAKPETTESTTKLGSYEVEAISARLATDYNDKPVIIVKYKFTNNAKSAISFSSAITDKAFQNGVECSQEYFGFGIDDFDNGNTSKDVQPGKTFELEVAYNLNDRTSDVVIECTEWISFSSKKYTKTFTIK